MKRVPPLLIGPVLAFLVTKLLVLVTNLWWFPTLKPVPQPDETELVAEPVSDAGPGEQISLLVPVRNETARLASRFDGLRASGAAEIVFLDDESDDGTAELISALTAQRQPAPGASVRVVSGAARPPGWAGKTWPCAQLADLVSTDVLVFCDADVDLAPGALSSVLAEMDRQDADVFSVICRQRAVSWGERLITPLITDVILCLFPFGLLRAPVPSAATAEGMVLVFRRAAYEQLGGFAAVRGEIVEDVAIARLTRSLGLQLGLVLGGNLVQCRMYDDYRQVINGLGRGLVPVLNGQRWLLVAGWVLHLAAYTVPIALLPRSRGWRLAAVLGVTERLLVEAKTGGRDWTAALVVAASPVAAIPVVIRALHRRQVWKGREYQ